MRTFLILGALTLGFLFSVSAFSNPSEPNSCEREMALAAIEQDVPLGVLYAVGLTETGQKGQLRPFALNIEGSTFIAKSLDEALDVIRSAQEKGRKLIDVGCMQINIHYHGAEFDSIAEMFDPRANVRYAAEFLYRLRLQQGSWAMAVARYHAGPDNDFAQKRYICGVIGNLAKTGFGKWTPEAKHFCGQ